MRTIDLEPIGVVERLLWTTAQLVGLLVTAVLIVGFFARPDTSLNVLWNGAIPLLPAVFLVNPAIWRNACPLATLGMLPNSLAGRRPATRRMTQSLGAVGILLLAVMVPARRFLFNTNGVALAATVIAVGVAALLLGALFDAKAGFCNSLCPVLPVERLYGQRPLLQLGNAHCASCTLCTESACLDLAPTKSVGLTFGRSRNSHAWLHTAYGAFAAAFPGFVIGYNLTQDGPLSAAGAVYLQVAAWSVASFGITYVLVRGLNLRVRFATMLLGGTASTFYYWYAAPTVVTSYGLPETGTTAIRGTAFLLIGFWFWSFVSQERSNGTERTGLANRKPAGRMPAAGSSSGNEPDLFEEVQLREWRATLTALVSGLFAVEAITGLVVYFGPFSVTAQVMVLLHVAVGLAFAVPYVVYQVHHWQTNRQRPFNQHKLLGYLSLAALATVVVSGLWLTAQAGWGRRISYGWDQAHLISGLAATALVVWHIVIIMGRHARRTAGAKAGRMRRAQALFARRGGVAVALAGLITAAWVAMAPVQRVAGTFPDDYQFPFGDSPFAPSLAMTASGGALVAAPLGNSERCGDGNCHAEIVEEWLPSAHRYASMSPFFQSVQAALASSNGPESTRYCGGCHDPIALFSGLKSSHSDDLSGIGAEQGVSCVVCHSIESTDIRGNAHYTVAPQPRYLHELSERPLPAWLGRFLIRAYPRQHLSSWTRSLYKTPEYCGACHKQFIDKEINDVGWIQLQNQYDTWRQSRWNVPDDPTRTITCRECHMRLVDSLDPAGGDVEDYNRADDDGKHRSHRFLAANQYVPLLLDLPGAAEHVELTEKWLRGELAVPEITDKWSAGPAVPIQIVAPDAASPGEEISVQVVAVNNKPGHDFPTGPLDIIQAWIELEARDSSGRVLYESGKLDEQHFLPPDTTVFEAEAVDKDGKLIDQHNLWEMVGARFKRTLFPGYSDVASYSIVSPGQKLSVGTELRVRARLRYRKVDQTMVNFLFPDQDMTAAITDVSSAEATIRIEPAAGR